MKLSKRIAEDKLKIIALPYNLDTTRVPKRMPEGFKNVILSSLMYF